MVTTVFDFDVMVLFSCDIFGLLLFLFLLLLSLGLIGVKLFLALGASQLDQLAFATE